MRKATLAATPVDDAGQVELQQTLFQGHEGQQAGVEQEQKLHTSAQSEAVRHGTVLYGRRN